jgi:quercetin dioxygenase-like cupin family protein
MTIYNFDDKNIKWYKLGDFDHFVISVLDVDEQNSIMDVLVKFDAHQQIVLHRHKEHNNSFVVQGEHYLYEANGHVKEIRAVGSYTSSPASDEPHRECGGDEGAVVLFSLRGNGILYEVLDDEQNNIGTVSFQDFKDLFEANR